MLTVDVHQKYQRQLVNKEGDSLPRIFDNIDKPLLPALQSTLQTSARADFCVGYFNLRGWGYLSDFNDRWSGGDGSCCRLLVGMQVNPTDELRQALRQQQEGEEEAIDNQSAIRAKRRVAEEFRLQLTYGVPTNQDEAALRQLSAQIRVNKLGVQGVPAAPLARQAVSAAQAGREQPRHRLPGQQQPHRGRAGTPGGAECRCAGTRCLQQTGRLVRGSLDRPLVHGHL